MVSDSISLLLTVVNYLEGCAIKLLKQLKDAEAKAPADFAVKEENISSLSEIINRTDAMKKALIEIQASGEKLNEEMKSSDILFSELNSVLEQLYRITGMLSTNNLCVDKNGKLTN